MASWAWESGGANERPDFATRSRNELRQLLRLHAASDCRGGNHVSIRQFDFVGHTSSWANGSAISRPPLFLAAGRPNAHGPGFLTHGLADISGATANERCSGNTVLDRAV